MRKKILIVDDYAPFARSLALLLGLDFEVRIADSAEGALQALAAGTYDAILCDLNMPEMDGRALFQRVSCSDPAVGARMLFLSGGACSPELEAFAASRSDRVLAKPCDPSELRRRITNLIAGEG